MSTTIADVEGALRTWLRAKTAISAQVGQRVFFGVPDNVTFPCITLSQIGGGLLTGDTPIPDALINFECWADGRNKAQASAVMRALVGVLVDMGCGEHMDATTNAFGATVDFVHFFPDPETNQARYVVTASVSAVPR